ncbi:MAG: hypothetical protein SGILL_001732 [Bacillariaceae sp.]
MKSVNLDPRSKKRLRFASSKERSAKASANVYRSYKNRIAGGVTSASTREHQVHNPSGEERAKKRQRKSRVSGSKDGNKTVVIDAEKPDMKKDDKKEFELEAIQNEQSDEEADMGASTFASELELAVDRNSSEIFGKFNRKIWIYSRSLPEILHNLEKIVDILMAHMLSPAALPERPSPMAKEVGAEVESSGQEDFIVNLATTDILHLVAVLARDLRHEIHPYLHTKVLPRIITDLLNPPPPSNEFNKQPIPLDVTIVEASFRTLAYVFRYDFNLVVNDMESMRQYYGKTLGNRRELVRRLSGEVFAPLIRRMKNQNARERHIRRVLRALDATTKQPSTRILQRTQDDAVNGIAQLMFQLVRGISGGLHSNGSRMLRFLFEYLRTAASSKENRSQDSSSRDLVFEVVSEMMYKVCYNSKSSTFPAVSRELFSVFQDSVAEYEKSHEDSETIVKYLQLAVKVATFRSGYLLEEHTDKDLQPLSDTVSRLCSGPSFARIPFKTTSTITGLFCQLWVSLQDFSFMSIRKDVQNILKCGYLDSNSLLSLSVVLSRKLLPLLQDEEDKVFISSCLLSSAAEMVQDNESEALEVILAIATSVSGSNCRSGNGRNFSLFYRMREGDFDVSPQQQDSLLDVAMRKCDFVEQTIPNTVAVLRCVPLLAMLVNDEVERKYKRAAKWILQVLESSAAERSLIVAGLAMESFSFLSTETLASSTRISTVKNQVARALVVSKRLILSDPSSLWVIRGAASFVPLLEDVSMPWGDTGDIDALFDSLVPNLRSANHFLRLFTLKILVCFPMKHYVVNHADLDLTEDLDDEGSFQPSGGNPMSNQGQSGPCDVLKTLLELELSPLRLSNERELISLITKVDVLARSGRLPAVYAEAAMNHMLGVFHMKFSPLWPTAQKTIVNLLIAYESTVWPSLERELVAVMSGSIETVETVENEEEKIYASMIEEHFSLCQKWESSRGKDVTLFGDSAHVDEGDVPRFDSTDEVTVMESVWKAAALGHKITVKHSRVIVPLFLDFLHNELFPSHGKDQDARELHLENIVATKELESSEAQTPVLNKKLKAFLRAFSAMDGPQQLVHHKVLEKIFRSFLAHQDVAIVQLALSCLAKFKFEYLLPHAELIDKMLQKGKLRNALLEFAEVVESDNLDTQRRKNLIPIVSRVLFGRVSARAGKASSKDSPGARRAAVLSFLSILCKEESDFFPFLYLMLRHFVPQSVRLDTLENMGEEERDIVMSSLLTSKTNEMNLSGPVTEGFLHLLESVISQLGHRIISWVPQLTCVTVELCKHVAVKTETDSKCTRLDESNADDSATSRIRHGAVRTLCFQRISGLFFCYAQKFDFLKFSESIWAALDHSVDLLPRTVVRSQGSPALLVLLRTVSENDSLISLLSDHDKAVGAIVGCIAPTSMHSVMDMSLTIIENLLADDVFGQSLVRKYAPQLMEQFAMRLDGSEKVETMDGSQQSRSNRSATKSPTWRRELEILFRVSQFVTDGSLVKMTSIGNSGAFVERLCSLLVPFLETEHGTSDDDKLNVVGTLSSISSHLEPSAAHSLFSDLSGTLGPYRSKEGIKNLQVRHGIASLMDKLTSENTHLKDISSLLVRMTALDKKRVDEMDFETVIPALNVFTEQELGGSWVSLCSGELSSPLDLTPLINSCFNFLYDEDGVISRACFSALKVLVAAAGRGADEWTRLVESVVVPLTRFGLQCRDPQVRRYCILLVRETSGQFRDNPSVYLCGDMWEFCDDENHDLDFFLGITHVQIHRRARAYQRLRKKLVVMNEAPSTVTLSSQSLSNVLIPLTVHPIYECKTNSEEGLALESIATLGALSRLLSWSKYNNLLWSLITQFDRHPEQERYLVGAMCAMIDAFHFELVTSTNGKITGSEPKTSVWRSLENRIIPKMDGLLTKETTNRNGDRIKSLRPSIVLAMTKLYQKFPVGFFDSKLPGVITVICDVLRSRDSDSRDMARNTLAKIVCSVEMKYLADVVRELAVTLTEGYKLHVRAAVVHTILLELSKVYETPSKGGTVPDFDRCVAPLMDLIQEDLFGEANERKTSQETRVRYVKEAGGNKSVHSVELVSKMIVFSPTNTEDRNLSGSSVHCLISPFLERLRLPDVDAAMIRKIREVLARVVVGLSNNKSVTGEELLPFLYATIHPFIGDDAVNSVLDSEQFYDTDNDVDDASVEAIKISGQKASKIKLKKSSKKAGAVVEWRPSSLQTSSSEKTASEIKYNQRRKLRKVQDGSSAPKLTGSSRHEHMQGQNSKKANEPATISGIVFCLNLMSACFKKRDMIKDDELLPMMDPFVPLLTACVTHCRSTEISLVALKCLHNFLRVDLPSTPTCSKTLGSQTLKLLATTGSGSNQNHDLTQACFKTLTYIVNSDSVSNQENSEKEAAQSRNERGEQVFSNRSSMPLDPEQMKVLISLLQVSIAETDQHNPALNLIKAIMAHRFMSPEFYDLMESLLKLVVRSQKTTLRQQSADLFVRYLLDYPMSEDRFEQHLKQIVANISYEYQEGRMSGVALLNLVIEKIPQELLEKHAQSLFLPLVMQLLNDDSRDCRAKVSSCIVLLLNRASTDMVQTFHEYCVRWSQQAGPLRLASLQVYGLVAETRADVLRTSSSVAEWVVRLEENIQGRQQSQWEITYFSLVCIEKLSLQFNGTLLKQSTLWSSIVDCLIDNHPWIMMSSSRILMNVFSSGTTTTFLSSKDGLLFGIVRNLCFQLNSPEEKQNEDLTHLATKSLTLLLPIMKKHPELCYRNDEEDVTESGSEGGRDPVFWLVRRLSQISKNKGAKRRLAVYKCFAALASSSFSIIAPYLELMLESLHRTIIEGKNEIDNHALSEKRTSTSIFVQQLQQQQDRKQQGDDQGDESLNSEFGMAQEVLRLLEDSCESPDEFLTAYASVKRHARDKKEKRKSEEKSKAVLDPKAFAQQKIQKQVRNKERRKRRVNEQRRDRGGFDKRRRSS